MRRFVADVRADDPARLLDWLAALVEHGLLPRARVVAVRELGGVRVDVPLDGRAPAALASLILVARRRVDAALCDDEAVAARYVEEALFARRVAREPRGRSLEWVAYLREDDALSDWVLALAAVARLSAPSRR